MNHAAVLREFFASGGVGFATARESAEALIREVDREEFCRRYGHSWERLLPRGTKPYCRRCGLEVHS